MYLELISTEILFKSDLKWPKYGNKYTVLCIIYFLAIFLFNFVNNYLMATELKLDTQTTIIQICCNALNLGKV